MRTCPPAAPSAWVRLPAASVVCALPRSTTCPPSSSASDRARTSPLWRSVPAKARTAPASRRPMFTTESVGACTSKLTPLPSSGVSVTVRPAASVMFPPGASITPSLRMSGPTSSTEPPGPARTTPWLRMEPPCPEKRSRPSRKSRSDSGRVEATRPATSTTAPGPIRMPFGLTRNTRPFDCRRPRISDICGPVTRLSTALAALCWTNRTSSFGAIEKLCQLMTAPGVLVICSALAAGLANCAAPAATCGPVGNASARPPCARCSAAAINSARCTPAFSWKPLLRFAIARALRYSTASDRPEPPALTIAAPSRDHAPRLQSGQGAMIVPRRQYNQPAETQGATIRLPFM